MFLSIRIAALLVGFAALLPTRANGDESAALLARFRSEAPQGWARLEQSDDELSYSATLTWTDTYFQEKKKDVRNIELTWVRRPGCLRLKKLELDGKNEGRTTVAVHTETHLFEIRRAKDDGSSWQILHSGAIKQKTDLLYLVMNSVLIVRPMTSLSAGRYYHLRDLEGDSTITFDKAGAVEDGIRIDYRTSGRTPLLNRPFETKGSIVFDPANNWSVRSYQNVTPDGFRTASVNTFAEPGRDGVRPIASMRYETWAPHGSVLHEITYESTKSGAAPAERFRLADFGLPDPLGPLPSRFPTALVLAAAAVVCGLIALWFRRRIRKSRLAMTPS
jgi:hypothetical protein